MKKTIIIPLDYSSDSRLVSYIEVIKSMKDNMGIIVTNCLNFFDFNTLEDGYDVKIIKENGEYILLSELLDNDGIYTKRQIRKAHNVMKLLLAGHFDFKKSQ